MKGLHLHIDCASGAAGDMLLGALIDLGVPLEIVYLALDQIGAGRQRLTATSITKGGIAAIDVKVDTAGELAGAHRHEHAAHAPSGPGVPTGPHHTHSNENGIAGPDHADENGRPHTHADENGQPHHTPASTRDDEGSRANAPTVPKAAHAPQLGRRPRLHLHAHSHAGLAHAHEHTHAHDDHTHSRADHSHGDHSHGDHSHGDHSHGDHSHGDHSHADHSHGDHSHADHSHEHEHANSRDDGSYEHTHSHTHGDQAHEHSHSHAQDSHADHEARADHAHADHTHAHGPNRPHAHYHYGAIRARIVGAALTEGTKRRALDIFDRLARAEARLHGTTVDAVAFHEVGAVDSVVDIVGTAAALDWLSPASVTCTGIAMGHGTLKCAHGVLPVPAPAALEVLREAGGITTDGGIARELCTPTGAAILAATVTAWTPAPAGMPVAIGWGAGDIDLPDRANVVRVAAIQPVAEPSDAVWQIDANLDDMSPELAGPAMEAIFAAGAVDAWWTPITMKKGRPAVTLSALAPVAARDAVIAAILRETTSIGVRFSPRERTVLARRSVEVTTKYGAIAVKVAMGPTGETMNVAPEYEACAVAAKAHGVPVKLVYAAALAAYGHDA